MVVAGRFASDYNTTDAIRRLLGAERLTTNGSGALADSIIG
ncbi:MAG: hypothetical protein Q7J27_04230 [Syntrophales bacterium]|nr:hypothetical protein [Syntrophales bacterium]